MMVLLEDNLTRYLELACQAQNMKNISAGRLGILSMPREWVLEHIETAAESLVQLNDSWEYRRLFEVYASIHPSLVRRLAARALNNPDPEIHEVGQDFLNMMSSAEVT